MDQESATLTLRSVNASSSTNNSWTWRNVDLRKALGTIYDEYNVFKICLTGFGSGTATITSTDDRNVILNLSGLLWVNAGYDYSTNTKTNTVSLCGVDLLSGNGRIVNYTGEYGVMFRKPPNGLADITLTYTRVIDNSINASQVYANNMMCFTIAGVEMDKHEIVGK